MSDKVYDKAWKLLIDSSRWIKKYYAVDCDGRPVVPNNPAAVKWCAIGALRKVYTSNSEQYFQAFNKLDRCTVYNIPYWNDLNTHDVVVNTLKSLDI